MSEEQPERPVTYKDVFGDAVQGEEAAQPVTVEDAALMQSAERMGLGKTTKGGAASLMQAAADRNVRDHKVDPSTHSGVAERGFGLSESVVDGKVVQREYVGQQPVSEAITFVPTLPEVAATQGITIGEALEEVAVKEPDMIVDQDMARTIQSAEMRATGIPLGVKGGVGATAQSAAKKNVDRGENTTISNVLDDATEKMLVDKVVTQEDVDKLKQVAGAGDGESVIISAMQEAVDSNVGADRYIQAQAGRYENADSLVPPAPSDAHDEEIVPPQPCATEHSHAD